MIGRDDVERLELYFSCRNLKNMDSLSKSDPQLILYEMKNNRWEQIGKTEVIKDNLNPNFTTSFPIDFYFERKQPLRVEVRDIDSSTSFDLIGNAYFELGQIVGSHNNVLIQDIVSPTKAIHGKLIVRFEKATPGPKEVYKIKTRGAHIANVEWFGKSDPFLRFYKSRRNSQGVLIDFLLVHETEYHSNNLNPSFKEFEITSSKLTSNDMNAPVKIEIWDHENSGKHRVIGETTIKMIDVIEKPQFTCKFVNHKKKKEVGSLVFEYVRCSRYFDFVDYLRGGLEISLIVGIDFTGSNGTPSRPESLHYMRDNFMNPYQKAITSVGEILFNYDTNKLAPTYGFGAKPCFPNFTSKLTSHCFPCSGNPSQSEGFGIEGVMQLYNYALRNTELSGPTYFAPLLQQVKQVVGQCMNTNAYIYTVIRLPRLNIFSSSHCLCSGADSSHSD